MNPYSFTPNLIRELRGSPLTVLCAFIVIQGAGVLPVTAQAIKDVTGYKDHTVTDALRILSDPTRQIVQRSYKGWTLSTAYQIPLTYQEQPPVVEKDIRVLRDKLLSSSSRYTDTDLILDPLLPPEENRDIRDKLPGYDAAHSAALTAGIRDPMADKIARLPDITPELITGHVIQTQAEGKHLGAAIYRIQHDWPVNPRYLPDPGDDSSRYTSGEFADFVEH